MATISRKTLSLGGREVKFAALSLRQLSEHKDAIVLLMGPAGQSYLNDDAREAMIELVVVTTEAAGDRCDREFLLDNINIGNFFDIGFALFDKNGFLAKEGEPGEVKAAPSPT